MKVFVTEDELSVDAAYKHCVRDDCGAVVVFTGNVRNHHDGKKVVDISYSAYAEMAEKEFLKIAEAMSKKWDIGEIFIGHRTGKLAITDISVIVAVSSAHRKEAFEAARYAIDTLKKTAPIWKEEFYEDGKAWVSG